MSKRILLTGGSGFVGRALAQHLVRFDYDVIILSRNPKKVSKLVPNGLKIEKWDAKSGKGWSDYANDAHAIINLAGENIGIKRWTKNKKQNIIESRINAAKAIIEAVEQARNKPKVIVQIAGIGYYGNRHDEILDETSSIGSGFLTDVAKHWEESIKEVERMGVRLAIVRMGVVLGKGGGFLSPILIPFRLFIGGHLGSGMQWISWIHIEDVIHAIQFLIENENLKGIFNLTSPNPVIAKDFFQTLGNKMKRPSWLHVPGFILRIIFGELASELILSGQRAVPNNLLEAGYNFIFPDVKTALGNILIT